MAFMCFSQLVTRILNVIVCVLSDLVTWLKEKRSLGTVFRSGEALGPIWGNADLR